MGRAALLLCFLCAAGLAAPAGAVRYNSKYLATTEVHRSLFGDAGWADGTIAPLVPPTTTAADGSTKPVSVKVSVMIEKIKIDTREQVATIKWWLRQAWKDDRLRWNMSAYTFGTGDKTGAVSVIHRPPGLDGGVWIPDMVIWESHFDGTQSTATSSDTPPFVEISHTGDVWWSCPQQVRINMVPRMQMRDFPFDEQVMRFTLGPWSHSEADQNTTFPNNNPAKFVALQGVAGLGDDSTYDETFKHVNQYVATEEWDLVGVESERRSEYFPCCDDPFATLVGRVKLRRASHFYIKFGVMPQIMMTMVGLVAHAFRGHRAGSVAFIASTGFTVALALTAHAVFFVEKLPVQRSWSFMEFTFLWSFLLSVFATCWSLYLFKKTEYYEEHVNVERAAKQSDKEWVAIPEEKKQAIRMFFWLDQFCVPTVTITYTLGLIIQAKLSGCNLYAEFRFEITIMALFCGTVLLAAVYDFWKSSEMIFAPHRFYKKHLKNRLAWIVGKPVKDYDASPEQPSQQSPQPRPAQGVMMFQQPIPAPFLQHPNAPGYPIENTSYNASYNAPGYPVAPPRMRE